MSVIDSLLSEWQALSTFLSRHDDMWEKISDRADPLLEEKIQAELGIVLAEDSDVFGQVDYEWVRDPRAFRGVTERALQLEVMQALRLFPLERITATKRLVVRITDSWVPACGTYESETFAFLVVPTGLIYLLKETLLAIRRLSDIGTDLEGPIVSRSNMLGGADAERSLRYARPRADGVIEEFVKHLLSLARGGGRAHHLGVWHRIAEERPGQISMVEVNSGALAFLLFHEMAHAVFGESLVDGQRSLELELRADYRAQATLFYAAVAAHRGTPAVVSRLAGGPQLLYVTTYLYATFDRTCRSSAFMRANAARLQDEACRDEFDAVMTTIDVAEEEIHRRRDEFLLALERHDKLPDVSEIARLAGQEVGVIRAACWRWLNENYAPQYPGFDDMLGGGLSTVA